MNGYFRPAATPYGYPMFNPGAAGQVPGAQMMPPPVPSGAVIPGAPQGSMFQGVNPAGQLPRLNLGKMATIYMTYENNREWNAKIFKGRLEAAGRDHIIISDPQTGMRYLLLMLNLDYITFDEELNYSYPYGGGGMPGR
jgi:spore germination protein Q